MTTDSQPLVRAAAVDIKNGSKSFRLASLFFSPKQKAAAWLLYSWCRYCDDQVDNAPADKIASVVANLRVKTLAATSDAPLDISTWPDGRPWLSLQSVVHEYRIPQVYCLDLISGFERDALRKPIQDQEDLELYCYGVAGAVGLMMCFIMGLKNPRSLPAAVALGRAMQMSNIARDIKEDALLNRCYLPETWLQEVGLSSTPVIQMLQSRVRQNATEPVNISASTPLESVVQKLLALAEANYGLGKTGLKDLPLRSRWAVAIALVTYRAIGRKVAKNPSQALKTRTIVSKWEKAWCLISGTFLALGAWRPNA